MPGFDTGSVMYALNVDFTGNSLTSGTAQVTTNGQLLIGSTSLPNIRIGTFTSPLGTITIGYATPNITIDVAGGASPVQHLTGDSGGTLSPVANNFNIDGWIYGLFCTERKDPKAPEWDTSSAVAQCGIVRTRDLKSWEISE